MIDTIAEKLESKQQEIQEFITSEMHNTDVPIYSSFDLRNSGYKVAAVDPNVFPAGFNNICQESLKAAAPVLEQIIRKRFGSGVQRIGLYTENHTKNKYYLQNLLSLHELFQDTGFETLLVTTNDRLDEDPAELETAMGDFVTLHQLSSENEELKARGNTLDLIISNNDLSTGVPDLLEGTNTPVTPPTKMGWWNRRKIDHFNHQHELLEEAAQILDLDPWHFIPETRNVGDVNFQDQTGFDDVAEAIDEVLEQTRQKYDQYDIDDTPTAFVKSNQGTYGMGVYHFDSGEEFLSINRDQRDSMARRKGGGENDSVVVQEGVRTVDRLESMEGELVAEPVIYCLEHRAVGGFLRTNEEQSEWDNLNSRGMKFSSEDLCTLFVDDANKNEGSNMTQNKIDVYKFMATVGTLACGREIQELNVE